MNANNAKSKGYQDGKIWQHNSINASRKEYEQAGRSIASHETRFVKTAALYCEGWNEAYQEPQATTPILIKPHNPNTRFCDCAECRQR